MNAKEHLIEIVRQGIKDHGVYALDDDEEQTLAEGIAAAVIEQGWPRMDYDEGAPA